MRGVRAERAEIVRIALPDSCWPDEAALDAAKRMLHERYGVRVGGLDSVPDWVTGNRRDAGRPPAEVGRPAARGPQGNIEKRAMKRS